jgi:hypothetical protein
MQALRWTKAHASVVLRVAVAAMLALGSVGASCPPPTPTPTPTPTPPPPGGPQYLELLVRTSGTRLLRGGAPFLPFGAIQCCVQFSTPDSVATDKRPRRPAAFKIKGVPQNSRWPLASESWMDYTGERGANFYHFRFAPWYGDAEHESEWADIGGPMLGDGPEFNPAFWAKARELTNHAGRRRANVEAVVYDTWYGKTCQQGTQPCALPQSDIDAVGRRPSPGQERFIRKVVQELGCFGNVIWITDNEGGNIQGTTREWYEWVRNVVRDEEQKSGCGIVHLVGTNNTDFASGPYDYVATHERAALVVPISGKHTENNERNPEFSPEWEQANFCRARERGLHYWFWRAGMDDATFEQTLSLFGSGCGPQVGCFVPAHDDPKWLEPPVPHGGRTPQMLDELRAAQQVVGNRCLAAPDHGPQNETLALLAAELRSKGYCATAPWPDAVAIAAPDGWVEEYHAVAFNTGCFTTDSNVNPKFFWRYDGPLPTPVNPTP